MSRERRSPQIKTRDQNIVSTQQLSEEAASTHETLPKQVPTMLDLFTPFSASSLDEVETNFSVSKSLISESMTAKSVIEKHRDITNERLQRVINSLGDTTEQNFLLSSSVTAGLAYLLIENEMSELGASTDETNAFFQKCMQTNLKILGQTLDDFFEEVDGVKRQKPQKMYSKGEKVDISRKILKDAPEPQAWFSGDRAAWNVFYLEHLSFDNLINNQHSYLSHSYGLTKRDMERFILPGYTTTIIEGGIPDWWQDQNFNKDAIQKELREDIDQWHEGGDQRDASVRRQDFLIKKQTDRVQKMDDFFKKRSYIPVSNIVQLGISLHTYHMLWPHEDIEKAVEYYSLHEYWDNDPSFIALWMESSLRAGNMLQSDNDELPENLQSAFSAIFSVNKDEPLPDELVTLKTENKKGYNAIVYNIKPYTDLLTDEQLEYLHELTQSNETSEALIWEIASLVGQRITETRDEPRSKPLAITLDHTKKFRKKWLRDNWEWVYSQTKEGIQHQRERLATRQHVTIFQKSNNEQIVHAEALPAKAEQFTEETNQEIAALAAGNLSGWKIYYAHDRRTDADHLELLPGESMEEREEALSNFIGTNNISCNIKPGSIVNALDWLVEVPDGVEQLRHKKTVGKEEFKKIKRGDVRLLYKVDRDEQKIVFFIHQKKAYSYHF